MSRFAALFRTADGAQGTFDLQAPGHAGGPVDRPVGPAALARGAQRRQFLVVLWLIHMLDPIARHWHRPSSQVSRHRRGAIVGSQVERTPAPALGAFDEFCAERVALDVAADAEEVSVGLDRAAFEAALV